MGINLDYYKSFYHVAKLGSLTLAARALFITQPGLSKSILQLERALGCRLFHRRRKGMVLTQEGEMLYRHISQAYERIIMGERALKSMLDFRCGEISVGSSDVILQGFLLPKIAQFRETYPDIKVNTSIITMDAISEALRNESIDLAITTSPVPQSGDLSSTSLLLIQDIFVGGPAYRHLEGKRLSLNDLMTLPLICPVPATPSRKHYDAFFRSHGIFLSPAFELSTAILILPFVESNLGVGMVVREFVQRSLASGALFEITTEHPIPPRELFLITKKKNRISQAGREFINTLTSQPLKKPLDGLEVPEMESPEPVLQLA